MDQAQPVPYPPQAPPAPLLTGFPIVMQQRMTRLNGQIFPAAGRLYFVCEKSGSAWAQTIGMGVGGLVGAAIMTMGDKGPSGGPGQIDEATVFQATQRMAGSLVMEAAQITMIKQTIWMRLIKFNGTTYGLPQGMSKPLRAELGRWAKHHNVPHKGLG